LEASFLLLTDSLTTIFNLKLKGPIPKAMRKLILSLAFCAVTFVGIFAVPNPIRYLIGESYIEQYRQIAIMESLRTGIPASIKLAQGLLESGFGQGKLAQKSNNHFGIKWRSSVDGDYVESYDDEYDKNGKKIVSRFVKFSSPEESYQQHSELLMTRPAYRMLFTYDRADYRAWAYGLKKAGYATNPKYAERLIQLIEQYHLERFDIPSQLDLNETQQTQTEFYSPDANGAKPNPSSQPFPTPNKNGSKKEIKPTINRFSQHNNKKEEEEEEHILYEVTSDVASKNADVVKNPVPKRQKK
jgi:GR25 family glycosyltransferase involved in LPS biosynthesis